MWAEHIKGSVAAVGERCALKGDSVPKPVKEQGEVGERGESGVSAKRPNIIPDRFNGKTPWRDYKRHFKACRLVNGWTDSHAKVFLAASLQGEAIKVLASEGNNATYAELVDLLEKRFVPVHLAENHLVELRYRQQGPKELLQELGRAIRDLTALAYPKLSEEGRDRLARGHFLDAVREQAV